MLIVIRGPAGAGKSTVARLVLAELPGKVAFIRTDRFLAIPKDGTVLDPEHLYLAYTAAGRAARTFLDAGYTVVAEGALVILELPVFLTAAGLGAEAARIFTLLPSLEETVRRNRARESSSELSEERARRLYEWVSEEAGVPGTRIDNSFQSPEQTAALILAELQRPGTSSLDGYCTGEW